MLKTLILCLALVSCNYDAGLDVEVDFFTCSDDGFRYLIDPDTNEVSPDVDPDTGVQRLCI